jgi:xylan 1,4-beta-xylosidase
MLVTIFINNHRAYPMMNWLKYSISLLGLTLCLPLFASNQVVFKEFTYTGKDELFSKPLNKNHYQNPILSGFYPDPSIVRVGEEYFLANSSFSFFPGVPIHKSRDLVNWELIGYALNRPSQLNLIDQQASRGIFAPTLRYHKGVFYLITTHVDGLGNFIVTAGNPAGPWSDPIVLPEVGGIDPDIFFDDDGKIYIAHNDAPEGEPLYDGHRAIWLWEYDPIKKKVIPESRQLLINGGVDISKKPIWIEGPHLYKINGWYYLLCAEGGTSEDHSQVVFRSRSLKEPFIPYERNPILTQRDLPLDRPDMVTSAGHADLVQTPTGEWWAVFLATRPYENVFYNTGRETFLLPVTWKEGWPVILEKSTPIPLQVKKPEMAEANNTAPSTTGNFVWKDKFAKPPLRSEWNTLNTPPASPWYRIKNGLHLTPSSTRLTGLSHAAFLARKQQHMGFEAETVLQLPLAKNISAGIVAFQNEKHHYFFAVRAEAKNYTIYIAKAKEGGEDIISSHSLPLHKEVTLGIDADKGKISFYYRDKNRNKNYLLKDVDGKYLSTKEAGGFVGTHIGLHARTE